MQYIHIPSCILYPRESTSNSFYGTLTSCRCTGEEEREEPHPWRYLDDVGLRVVVRDRSDVRIPDDSSNCGTNTSPYTLFPWRNIHSTSSSSLSLCIYILGVQVDGEISSILRLLDANSPRRVLHSLRSTFRIDPWRVLIHRYLGSIWASLRRKMTKTSCLTNNQGYLCINSKSKNNIFIQYIRGSNLQ